MSHESVLKINPRFTSRIRDWFSLISDLTSYTSSSPLLSHGTGVPTPTI